MKHLTSHSTFRTPQLRGLISLFVAEVFLCSVVSPSWVYSQTDSHLRPAAVARDGGRLTQLKRWLRQTLSHRKVNVSDLLSGQRPLFTISIPTTEEFKILEKSLYGSLRSADQIIELGSSTYGNLYRLVRHGGYKGPYLGVDLKNVTEMRLSWGDESSGFDFSGFQPVQHDFSDIEFMRHLILQHPQTVILSTLVTYFPPDNMERFGEKLVPVLSAYPVNLQIHDELILNRYPFIKGMIKEGWIVIVLKERDKLNTLIFLRPNGKLPSTFIEFLERLTQDPRFMARRHLEGEVMLPTWTPTAPDGGQARDGGESIQDLLGTHPILEELKPPIVETYP